MRAWLWWTWSTSHKCHRALHPPTLPPLFLPFHQCRWHLRHLRKTFCAVIPNTISTRILTTAPILIPSPPHKATGVFLRVKGLERVNFTERRTGRDAEDRDRMLSDEVSFFNVTMPLLTTQAGLLQPGQYQIPFSFSLPASLPGTYPEEEGMRGCETYRCSIDYEVLAYVEVPGVFTNNIRHRQLLAVTANMDPKAIHAETVVKNNKVCFLCCIPRGEIWMRASMDKSHYMPGETAMIMVEMNNGSRAAIRHVSLRLLRQLRLGTRSQGKELSLSPSLPPSLPFSFPAFGCICIITNVCSLPRSLSHSFLQYN